MIVAGVDSSLTATGIGIARDGLLLSTSVVRSAPPGKGRASLWTRQERLLRISREVRRATRGASLLVIESPSYGSVGGAKHDRSGLWWMILQNAVEDGVLIAEVAPRTRALYGSGNGGAGKAEVRALVGGWLDPSICDDNEVDAAILAAMGARFLGSPIDGAEKPQHKRAMAAVAWPNMKGRTT